MALVQRLQALYGRVAHSIPDRLGDPAYRSVTLSGLGPFRLPVVQVNQSQLERFLGAEAVMTYKDTLCIEVPRTFTEAQCTKVALEGRTAQVLHIDTRDLLVYKVYIDPRRNR